MGYRIVYGKEIRRLSKRTKKFVITILICVGLLSVGYFCRPKLPEAALENMAGAIRNGDALSDAFTTFCQEIIANAEDYS